MKKFICCILAALAVILVVGCAPQSVESKVEELEHRISELEKENEELKENLKLLEQLTLNGNFYTVTEGYEKGWITKEELKSIAYYHNGGRAHNEEVIGEDFKPISKTPETLSDTVKQALIRNYYNNERPLSNTPDINEGEIWLTEYCGLYNGCITVVFGNGIGYDALAPETVGGVTIYFSYLNRVLIWTTK